MKPIKNSDIHVITTICHMSFINGICVLSAVVTPLYIFKDGAISVHILALHPDQLYPSGRKIV